MVKVIEPGKDYKDYSGFSIGSSKAEAVLSVAVKPVPRPLQQVVDEIRAAGIEVWSSPFTIVFSTKDEHQRLRQEQPELFREFADAVKAMNGIAPSIMIKPVIKDQDVAWHLAAVARRHELDEPAYRDFDFATMPDRAGSALLRTSPAGRYDAIDHDFYDRLTSERGSSPRRRSALEPINTHWTDPAVRRAEQRRRIIAEVEQVLESMRQQLLALPVGPKKAIFTDLAIEPPMADSRRWTVIVALDKERAMAVTNGYYKGDRQAFDDAAKQVALPVLRSGLRPVAAIKIYGLEFRAD